MILFFCRERRERSRFFVYGKRCVWQAACSALERGSKPQDSDVC